MSRRTFQSPPELYQPCNDRPENVIIVSPIASERLGWAWMSEPTSDGNASQLTAKYPSWSSSLAQGPTKCSPNIGPPRAATTFTNPSVSPTIIARPLPANECLCTSTSYPASRASASVIPAQATSGCVYTTQGTLP